MPVWAKPSQLGGTMRTYAMQVATGRESKTVELIDRVLGHAVAARCFVPRFQFQRKVRGAWTLQEEFLTPGYVYLTAKKTEVAELAERLRRVPAMTKLLATAGKITPLTQEETAWLLALTGPDHVVEPSIAVAEGDRIRVTDGPLKGFEAQIKKIDRHKRLAYVEGRLFGRPKVVKVGLEVVGRIERGADG